MKQMKFTDKLLRHQKNERGQGLTELALIVMLLVLIAFGVMDLARIFHSYVAITGAAREGVRYITRNPSDLDGSKVIARAEGQNAGIDLSSATIDSSCTPVVLDNNNQFRYCDFGSQAVVTISYSFKTIVGSFFTDSPLTITQTARMMVP